jgi:GT2 family glycosyltransferase
VGDLNVFVAPSGNAFMRDLAAWLVEAGELLGRRSSLRDDGAAPDDVDAVNLVVAPHEYYLLSDFDDATIHRAAQISTPICTEQPGTPWFDITAITAGASAIAIDINPHGVEALRERGIDAHHLRVGAVPTMAARPASGGHRDVDVVFLGGRTAYRSERLAQLAPALWDRHADLRLFSFSHPVADGTPGLVFGQDKYRLLAGSRILLNIHRDDTRPGYFEWARLVEAMANGCCVVTEPVADFAPFVEGEHFIATEDLEAVVTELLDDPARCDRIGEAGRRAVLEQFPLTTSLAPLLDDLERRPSVESTVPRRVPRYRRRMTVAQQHPLLPAFQHAQEIRVRLYRALIAETSLQRQIERTRCLARFGTEDHVEVIESAAYGTAEPDVSVVVTLYNYAQLVLETLESIIASEAVSFEIIIVDDHSTDGGRDTVREFIAAHPDVAVVLLGSDINRGLPAARNLGFGIARAVKVMVMDADNLVYPSALRKIAAALDAHPEAAFAYSTLGEFGVAAGIRSAMGWHPPWLCERNYIDAQAMIRTKVWERHGGYRVDDDLVFGWEDWELWLRLAAAGEFGVHVPQMLGRYRTQQQSMISTTNLVADHMIRHLRELHPSLPWPSEG